MIKSIAHNRVPAMLLLLWMTSPLCADVRTIAVLATSDAGIPVTELVTANLSLNEAISLVERQRIVAIMTEQRLTVFGNRSDALKLGELLEAEAFAVWEQAAAANEGHLVVFDTTRGIRLDDQTLTAPKQDTLAARVAQAIELATTKLQAAEKEQLHLVSVTGYRNVDVPPELMPQLESITERFQQRLTNHPEIAVLEREQLRLLMQEDSLPIAKIRTRALLSASTATLEFSRVNSHTLKVLALIKHPHVAERQQVSLQLQIPDDSSKMPIDDVAMTLIDGITIGFPDLAKMAPTSASKEAEAGILIEEALRLNRLGQNQASVQRLEAAYMLSPQVSTLERLFHELSVVIHYETMKHTRRGLGSREPMTEKLSSQEWLDLVRLGHYQMHLQRLLHEYSKASPHWPMQAPGGPGNDLLTPDFNFNFGLTRAVLEIDANRQPEAFAAVQDYFAAGDRMVFEEFARDVPQRLSGAELQRFNRLLQQVKIKRLFSDSRMHFMTDWGDVFASHVKEHLQEGFCPIAPSTLAQKFKQLPKHTADEIVNDLRRRKPLPDSPLRYFIEYADFHRHIDWEKKTSNDSVHRDLEAWLPHLRSAVVEKESFTNGKPANSDALTTKAFQPRYDLGELFVAACHLHRDDEVGRQTIVDACFYFLDRGIAEPWTMRAIYQPSYLRYHAGDLAVIEKVLARLKTNTFGLSTREHMKIVTAFEQRRQRVSIPWDVRDWKHANGTLPRAWGDAKELELPPVEEYREVNATAIRGDQLFVATIRYLRNNQGIELELFRKRPDVSAASVTGDDAWTTVAKMELPQQQMANQILLRRGPNNRELDDAYFRKNLRPGNLFVDDANAFLLTGSGGIIVFPLIGTAPYQLTTAAGLPSNTIQQLVTVGGQVFAWVGDAGQTTFVEIDLITKRVKTIASCQRQDAMTPIDNFLGARCRLMMPWPDSSRILFIVDDGYELQGDRQQYSNRNGTWQYHLQSGKITKYVVGGFLQGQYGRVSPHQFVVGRYDTKNKRRLWRLFDLTTDKFQELGEIDVPPRSVPLSLFENKLWWYPEHERTTHCWDLSTKTLTTVLALPENENNDNGTYGESYEYGFGPLGDYDVAIWGRKQVWLSRISPLPTSD